MFLKHKQPLHLQKAVCGWEIKWSKSHQYLPSFVSTCLSDTFLFFRMKKRAEAFPTHGPPPSMMLYVWGSFYSHCLRSEDTIGWQRSAEKLTRDTQDRERKESNTFLLLFLFFAPCFLCLPSSKLEIGMSNPFPSRLDQLGAAEFTGGAGLLDKSILDLLTFC